MNGDTTSSLDSSGDPTTTKSTAIKARRNNLIPVALIALCAGLGIGIGVGAAIWADSDSTMATAPEPEVPAMGAASPLIDSLADNFYYDPKMGHTMKTNSYMPFMPALDGFFQTHYTYRFLSVREQVLSIIGEAKHGLWRIQDNGMVRLYRIAGKVGVPVMSNVTDLSLEAAIESDYKAVLAPGIESGDAAGWAGYRYSQDADGDGQAAFVDVPIYHPYFDQIYEDHVPIDLPHWYCTMSGPNYTDAIEVWNFVAKQPQANKVGPLGQRAGLDIKEHYPNVIKMDLFADANMWVNVGMGDEARDTFNQADIDSGEMSMDVAFRALDLAKVDYEIYMIERPFFNVPYLFVTVVIDNKENTDMRYTRPDGLYWDGLVERGLSTGLTTTMTFDPVVAVIESDGTSVNKKMRFTPFYGLNHLDRPNDDGSGGFCPAKGGDWGSYPSHPGGAGFPNEYEEITPLCDAFVLDVKIVANLDEPTWNSPRFSLMNAGTLEATQTYLGEGNKYGDFTDPYLVANGIANPHILHFTEEMNPDPAPLMKINVNFEDIGVPNKYIDPRSGETMPAPGLTVEEAISREQKNSAAA